MSEPGDLPPATEEAAPAGESVPAEEATPGGEAVPAEEAAPGGEAAPAEEAPPQGLPPGRLPSILESLLFVADRPLTASQLAALVEEPEANKVEAALILLASEWSARGVQLHPVAGGWQLRSHPQNATWVQRLVAQKPVRLTRSQLETLAICAYRQPITRPEIDEIRGVDTGGTLKTLLERSLVRILGKKEEPGRPLLYGTTREFLEFFNLRDLRELPTLREFHELSDEHRAQVEALERAAPPGTVEPRQPGEQGTLAGTDSSASQQPQQPIVPPLARVELSEAPLEEDLGQIDKLIEEAGTRARAAAEALGTALPETGPDAKGGDTADTKGD